MSEKADITFSRDKGGNYVATPDPFVLKKGVTRIWIRNESDTDIQINLGEFPVEENELRIAARAAKVVTVKGTVKGGQYSYGASAAPPVHRQSGLEASPKIIAEASPKIIVECSSKTGA